MSHKGVVNLLRDAAKSLGDDIGFDYARTSDFNITASKKRYPFIVLDPLTAIPTYSVDNVYNFVKTWSAQMAFYDLDREGSTQDEYEKILNEMDKYVDNFINKLNFYTQGDSINSDNILISGISQQPFVKTTSAILTGYIISFQVQVTGQFNYCGLDC